MRRKSGRASVEQSNPHSARVQAETTPRLRGIIDGSPVVERAARSDFISDSERQHPPLFCPREGCGGRVFEDQEHTLYCINCGWQQESANPKHCLDYIRKLFFRKNAQREGICGRRTASRRETRAILKL